MKLKAIFIIILSLFAANILFAVPAFHQEYWGQGRISSPSDGYPIYPQQLSASRDGVDTLKLAVIRVEFQWEEEDNPKTEGNGRMDLTPDYPDSIPHDKAYFSELVNIKLDAYFKQVSYGQLRIQGDIFPAEDNLCYTLPQEMKYYGDPLYGSQRNCEMLQEAIALADGDIDFSQYHTVMLFHAGAGEEGAPEGMDYSDEIFSGFMNFDDLKEYLGNGEDDYEGIPTNDEVVVREGTIMPETLIHYPYYPSQIFGMLGIMAHEFGYQLGWKSLYNTYNQNLSLGIGQWGLMGYGVWAGNSFIPSHPCAWTRMLGMNMYGEKKSWVDVREYSTAQENIEIYQINAPHPVTGRGEVVKIPITATEYFLIENRQPDVNHDGSHNGGFDGYDFENYYTAEFDYQTPFHGPGTPPYSGLLIWHIDESIIEENWDSNRINKDRHPKGVDLEEADGFRDLDYKMNLADSTDHFKAPYKDEFSTKTSPSTDTNIGASSTLRIYDISESDSIMTFSISFGNQEGWPRNIGVAEHNEKHYNLVTPLVADLNDDGFCEIITTAIDTVGLANGDSTQILEKTLVYALNDTGMPFAGAWPIDLGEVSVKCSPAAADIDGDGDMEIFLGTDDGTLYGWNSNGLSINFPAENLAQLDGKIRSTPTMFKNAPKDDNYAGVLVAAGDVGEDVTSYLYLIDQSGIVWQVETPKYVESSPAVADLDNDGYNEVVVTTWYGNVSVYDHTGQEIWTVSLDGCLFMKSSPVITNLDRGSDGTQEIIVPGDDGWIYALDHDGNFIEGWPVNLGASATATPALADIDKDGYVEIIVPTKDKTHWGTDVVVLNHSGSLVEGLDNIKVFPVNPNEYWGGLRTSVAVGDVDGDDNQEIILGTPDGRVLAWNNDGTSSALFPRQVDGGVNSSPILVNLDPGDKDDDPDNDDDDLEVVVSSNTGQIAIWDLEGKYNARFIDWPTLQGNIQRTGHFPGALIEDPIPTDPDSSDTKLLTDVYCYPNPTNVDKGSFVFIRYTLGSRADANIKIFNLAGEIVAEFDAPGIPNQENEIMWNLNDIASGVYVARIKAESDKGSATEFIKIGVVK